MIEKPPAQTCETCLKASPLCICPEIKKLQTRYHVLILQHPQEPDKELGSARLANLALPNSTLKVGLSWRNLSAALGREAQNNRWAILYLGSGAKTQERIPTGLTFTNKNGVPYPADEARKIRNELEGIIVLDGTWSQAKTLWWRNAWLLKLRRAILNPAHKSLYGPLRKEPRKECLSTIESIAESLTSLGEPEQTGDELRALFSKLLGRYKESRTRKSSRASR
jgi:DTW domain-containing protein YfiP